MARPIWSGSINFGLIYVPVKLYSAVKHKEVHFHEVSRFTGARIREKRVTATGQAIDYKDIAKGYPLTKRKMVIISPEELKAADPKSNRVIGIEDFVGLNEIDPVFFLKTYYVVPDASARKAYTLLLRAMQKSKKIAIAKLVMRQRQYLAALRPVSSAILLSTMLYADELVSEKSIPGLGAAGVKISAKEEALARKYIGSLSGDFSPAKYKDEYRRKVLALIKKKAKGKTIVTPKETKRETRVADLLAQLEQTVVETKTTK